MKTLMKALV